MSNKRSLITMFILTLGFFLVEIIVGYITNSVTLIADSFHMLSDVVALVVAFLSVVMSPKQWSKNTFGWARAEVLGALVNAVFLVALCFSILVQAVKRFCIVEEVQDPELVFGVGVGGLVVNIVGLFLFHNGHGHSHQGHSHSTKPVDETSSGNLVNLKPKLTSSDDETDEDTPSSTQQEKPVTSSEQLNMKGVFLHIVADALGSVIVVISALVIWLTEWKYKNYLDPTLSLILVVLIVVSVIPLLKESALILLQTVPTHIQVKSLQTRLMREIPGVLAVHEFHIWQLAGKRIIATAHIRCRDIADYFIIAERVKQFFHREGIHSTTIQPEFIEHYPGTENAPSKECLLNCPPDDLDHCYDGRCCQTDQSVLTHRVGTSANVTEDSSRNQV